MHTFPISTLLLALVSLLPTSAFAFPMPDAADYALSEKEFRVERAFGFDGIIKLSNCSGALVRLTRSLDTDPALLLTNGHCVGEFIEPGKIISNRPALRSVSILNPSDGRILGTVSTARIVYATMTKTDLAVYTLQNTFLEIEQRFGVRAIHVAEKQGRVGDKVAVVSGFFRRVFSCSIHGFVPTLKEDKWTMKDSLRYSRPGCEVIGGTSGSPVIAITTGEVVGVNNTINEDGETCTMNNPCEVDAEGKVTVRKGTGYAQATHLIYTCLNSRGAMDLGMRGCLLPSGK